MLRNNVTSEIRKAQTNYYKSKIEENNGNNKRMWRTIKHLLNKSKSQCINNEDLSPSKFNRLQLAVPKAHWSDSPLVQHSLVR